MGFKLPLDQAEIDYEAIPRDKGLIMTNSGVLSESLSMMATWNCMILCKTENTLRLRASAYVTASSIRI
jgi:hypothetical protein